MTNQNDDQTANAAAKLEEEYQKFLTQLAALREEENKLIEEYKKNLEQRRAAWIKKQAGK